MTTQPQLFDTSDAQGGATLDWFAWGFKPGRHYQLQENGRGTPVSVHHCGHPTALWPYYIQCEWLDEIVVAPNGRGFQLLADAKQRAVQLYLEHKASLS